MLQDGQHFYFFLFPIVIYIFAILFKFNYLNEGNQPKWCGFVKPDGSQRNSLISNLLRINAMLNAYTKKNNPKALSEIESEVNALIFINT